MCLNIDGQTFCDILEKAPKFEGESLERVEHNMEENKRPYTDEVAQLLAKTCGLDFNVYHDRIIRIRGENVLRQVRYNARQIVNERGPYFVLPPECGAYIEGMLHEIPQIAHITKEAQSALESQLTEFRFARFANRIDVGITQAELNTYPEKNEWVPKVQELWTRKGLAQYGRNLFEQDRLPEPGIFYPDGQVQKLLKRYAAWFDNASWHMPPALVRAFLDPQEIAAIETHILAWNGLAKKKPKRKRGRGQPRQPRGWRSEWDCEKQQMRNNYRQWKLSLMERYWPLIVKACISGIPIRAEQLPRAA